MESENFLKSIWNQPKHGERLVDKKIVCDTIPLIFNLDIGGIVWRQKKGRGLKNSVRELELNICSQMELLLQISLAENCKGNSPFSFIPYIEEKYFNIT